MDVSIHGYAIVSADDRITDASGQTPPALMNDADWAYFQAGLDAADLVVLGRLGHESNPNRAGRRRVVVSRSGTRGLEQRDDAVWWNPQILPWQEASSLLLPSGGGVAVPGGRGVFDLFLEIGYTAFHLSRAESVTIGQGERLFSGCSADVSAGALLEARGLAARSTVLDPSGPVTLTIYGTP